MWKWPRNVLFPALFACGLLLPALALAEPVTEPLTAAEADSLVWYIEALERDLAVRDSPAYVDSLEIRLELLTIENMGLKDQRTPWYKAPELVFPAGVGLGALLVAVIVRVSIQE